MNMGSPKTINSVFKRLYFLLIAAALGVAALSAGTYAFFMAIESSDLKAISVTWSLAYFLAALFLLSLSYIYLKKCIRGNSDIEKIEIIKRTKEVDELLERETEELQRDRAAINAVTSNWIKPFYLWGSFCRYMSVFLLLWMIPKWLPLDNLANKPILEISLREIGSIIIFILIVRVAFYWISTIDKKTQREREEIYSGWGLAGIAVITLALLLFYW